MTPGNEAWLGLALLALFGALLFLRVRYPHASKGAEIVTLLGATILFLSICNSFLRSH
jgi:hypothetical protein